VPDVSGGIAGVQLQRAAQFQFRAGPVPVVQLGKTESGVSFRVLIVDLDGPLCRGDRPRARLARRASSCGDGRSRISRATARATSLATC
jgi:hypothetical protein